MRFQKIEKENIIYINDAYNASPISVSFSLETFDKLYNDALKITVLGDMLELGEKEIEYHENIIEKALIIHTDKIYLYGERMAKALKVIQGNKEKITHFTNKEDIKNIRNKEKRKARTVTAFKRKRSRESRISSKCLGKSKKKCAKLSAEIEKAQVNQIEIQGKKKRRNSFIWKIWLLFWQLLWKMACPVLYAEVFIMKTTNTPAKRRYSGIAKTKGSLEEEIQAIYETLAGLRTQLQQEQQITFENLPISPKLTEELQKLQTEAAKKETEINGLQKRYTERKQEWEAENKEILQKENELEIQKQTAMVEDFQIAYEALQEKNRKREELQKLLETLEQKLDARIKNREKGEGIIQELKAQQTEASFLQSKQKKSCWKSKKKF